MSISLPNGTLLAAPSSSQAQVSAAVTRILHLSNFSAELKTRDLQAVFKEWESEKGGFRIKWVDDVNALVVFADAAVAKRAYLSLLFSPPAAFTPPAMVRPYDRPDAAQIIASLNARTMGHRASMSSNITPHAADGAHGRAMSMSNPPINGFQMPLKARTSIATGPRHQRTGSASNSWARQSVGGVLNFGGISASNSASRLPTHSENSSVEQSRSSSDEDVVVVDSMVPRTGARLGGAVRRESITADRALRSVEKALAGVEIRS